MILIGREVSQLRRYWIDLHNSASQSTLVQEEDKVLGTAQTTTKPIARPSIEQYGVHLWRVHVPSAMSRLPRLRCLLSADECARANRFHFEHDRNRFAIGRGVLRDILARYLGGQRSAVGISYGSFGKPIMSQLNNVGISFNLSHSGEWVVYALARECHVGVDIERIRFDINHAELANKVFSKSEQRLLNSMDRKVKAEVFFKVWTRKEAFLKAIGRGLSVPLSSVEVMSSPEDPPKLLGTYSKLVCGYWSMQDINVSDAYAGTLVLCGIIREVTCFDWIRGEYC